MMVIIKTQKQRRHFTTMFHDFQQGGNLHEQNTQGITIQETADGLLHAVGAAHLGHADGCGSG